jgi:hypothetical protein
VGGREECLPTSDWHHSLNFHQVAQNLLNNYSTPKEQGTAKRLALRWAAARQQLWDDYEKRNHKHWEAAIHLSAPEQKANVERDRDQALVVLEGERKKFLVGVSAVKPLIEILDTAVAELPSRISEEWRPEGSAGIAWTRKLEKRLQAIWPKEIPPDTMPQQGCPDPAKGGGTEDSKGSKLVERNSEYDEARDETLRKMAGGSPQLKVGKYPWGKMEVRELPMPIAAVEAVGEKVVRRAVEEGAVLAFPHRWAVDRGVFGRRRRIHKKAKTGSVLIDCSGSMRWSDEALMQVIDAAPAASVAGYSGTSNYGILNVLAKGGRRIDPSNAYIDRFSGNIIDGPALEWLAQQPQPRIWFSDGGATGIGDNQYDHPQAARKFCDAHGIRRTNSLAKAVAILKAEPLPEGEPDDDPDEI